MQESTGFARFCTAERHADQKKLNAVNFDQNELRQARHPFLPQEAVPGETERRLIKLTRSSTAAWLRQSALCLFWGNLQFSLDTATEASKPRCAALIHTVNFFFLARFESVRG